MNRLTRFGVTLVALVSFSAGPKILDNLVHPKISGTVDSLVDAQNGCLLVNIKADDGNRYLVDIGHYGIKHEEAYKFLIKEGDKIELRTEESKGPVRRLYSGLEIKHPN